MTEMVKTSDVWLLNKQAAEILGLSESTIGRYKKYLFTANLPKNGVFQSQLYLFQILNEEIKRNGVSKAKRNIREFIKQQQEQQQEQNEVSKND